jgi:glycosyltransferase involved in cell wall biosynthesis
VADVPRLCFVTPGHIASNPRLAKEASAAAAAGYDVRIVFSQYMDELVAGDASILERNPAWRYDVVVWRNSAPHRRLRRWSGVRQRLSAALFALAPVPAAGVRALNRVYDELLAAALREPADLYIAHNLAALPVAAAAADHLHALLTFDAEDFHRGDVGNTSRDRRSRRLIEWAERRFIPRAAAVSAASDGIAEAYAKCLGIARPTTILNVFEQSERDAEVPATLLANERRDAGRSLYWFSQTIGPHRGLEDAVDALAQLPHDVHLYVRGMWAAGYEATLRARASRLGVGERVHSHPTALAAHLVRLASCHDVGLALEQPLNENKRVCVSNKLFTYLLAGVPAAVSATPGQRDVTRDFPKAVRLYPPGDASALAAAIRELLDDESARGAALGAALDRYSWDAERHRFLATVEDTIGAPRVAVAADA